VLRESDNAGYGLPAFPLQLCRYNAGLLKGRLISIERRVGWNNQRGDLNTDKPWSETDDSDLKNHNKRGAGVAQARTAPSSSERSWKRISTVEALAF
jgi:hypothetical protein